MTKGTKRITASTKRQICQECGQRAWGGRFGSWRVADKIWAAAGYKPSDIACWDCLNERLKGTVPTKLRLQLRKLFLVTRGKK